MEGGKKPKRKFWLNSSETSHEQEFRRSLRNPAGGLCGDEQSHTHDRSSRWPRAKIPA